MSKKSNSTDDTSVLVLEDHAKLLRNIAFLLQVAGLNVFSASSCSEAQQILARQKPDLILADVDMSTDYEFLRNVRAERRNAAIPFIAMSGKYDLHDLTRTLDLGANDYLPKPFDAYDLMNVIRDNLAYFGTQRKAS